MTSTVLVIGLGYLGSAITNAFLTTGWNVRAVARSQAKVEAWLDKSAHLRSRPLSFVIVPDAEQPGALDDAMRDVEIVVNLAAMIPRVWQVENTGSCEEGIRRVLDATLNPLRSAARSPSVKRFIYIGSGSNAGPECRDGSWRQVTLEQASKPEARSALYPNTKVLAEQAAFRFVHNERPSFQLISLNPTMCLGPRGSQIVDPATPFFGNVGRFERLLLHPETDFAIYGHAEPRTIVDVRDVADACVSAARCDTTRGDRFILAAPTRLSDIKALWLVKQRYPIEAKQICKLPGEEDSAAEKFVDGALASEVLGIRYRPVETTILHMAAELLDCAADDE